MKIDKSEIPDARNLIYACECCGKQEGLKAFATMAALAQKLQEAIDEATDENLDNGVATKRKLKA